LGAGAVLVMSIVGWLPRVCALAIAIVPPLISRTVETPTARDALRTGRFALAYGVVLLALAWGDRLQGVSPTLAYRAGNTSMSTTPMLSLPPK
jgi:hypothetical protein